jgi:hypothetical protein
MIRLTTTLIVVLPLIAFAWTVVGFVSPELGMHDGDG